MFGLEWIVALGIGGYGYFKSRRFVREKLRFVEIVHKPAAPVAVGVATGVAAGVVVSVLPVVGVVTAVVAGVSIGMGVSHGAKDSNRLPAP